MNSLTPARGGVAPRGLPLRGIVVPAAVAILLTGLLPTTAWTQEAVIQLSPEWRQTHSLRVFTSADGLPQNSVNEIIQTRDGYVWMATFGGVARFDGVRFQVYDVATEPGLPSNRALSLLEDRDGTLWVGFQYGTVARRRPGERFSTLPVPAGLQLGDVVAIAQDSLGNVWLGGSQALVRVNASDEILRVADGVDFPALLADSLGMWAKIPGPRFQRFGSQGEELRDPLPLPANVRSLFRDQDALLWIGSMRGLRVHVPGLPALTVEPDLDVWGITADPEGRVWISGRRTGYVTVERAVDGSLAGRPVLHPILEIEGEATGITAYPAIFVDREGALWVGSRGGGVFLIRPTILRVYPLPPDERNREVATLAPSPDGSLWVGSCPHGITRFRDGVYAREPGLRETDGDCVLRLATDPEGRLWISRNPPDPLLGYGGGGLAAFPEVAGGRLLTGGEGALEVLGPAGLRRWSGDAFVEEPAPPELRDDAYREVALRDGSGRLWAGGDGGLLRWDGRSIRTYVPGPEIPRGTVRAIHADWAGRIWVGTYGGGISVLTGDSARHLTTATGLADNFVSAILPDAEGNLWLNGNRFLSVIPREQADAFAEGRLERVLPLVFGNEDGFVEAAGPNGAVTADGRLWFGTLNGLMVADPVLLRGEAPEPAVIIEAIIADETTLEEASPLVPAGTAQLEIAFTAPTFLRPAQTRFRYRLEPRDQEWRFHDTRRSVSFNGLQPGAYTLRVQASTLDGRWSPQEGVLSFAVQPFFWQTLGFRGSALLLLVGLVYGGAHLRMANLRRRTVVLQTEIDERKRAEAQRDRVEAQLRRSEKLKAVGQLTGGVAHDFNNLLTVVLGNVELAHESSMEPEVRSLLKRAEDAAIRGSDLTRQLLAFSRRQPLEARATDLRKLLEGMSAILGRALGEAVKVDFQHPPDLWSCRVDRSLMESAVLNLAINARDAMPGGGTLLFLTRNHAAGEGGLQGVPDAAPGEYVVLEVRDSGTGIPAAILDRIFDPFFTTKSEGKGSGLGLSMVYGFVRQSGGHLTVTSQEGVGTTFRIFLPRADAQADPAGEALEAAPGRGEAILVVDDDHGVRDVTVEHLRGLGFQALAAIDAADALMHLGRKGRIDLLLTDVVLPGGMSGLELAQEVRRLQPGLPVLLMSGFADGAEGPPQAPTAGFPLLQKPFTRADLHREIRRVLPVRKGAGSPG